MPDFMVRHGQASFGGDNYDQLSTLGEDQSAALGHAFAASKTSVNSTYVGPRRRHQQTHDAVAGAY